MKAMAKDPDDRYGSAEELRADLLRFADGRPVEAGDPGVTSMMAAVGVTQAVAVRATGRTMAIPAGPAPAAEPRGARAQEAHPQPASSCWSLLLVALAVIAFFLLRSVGVFGGNVDRARRGRPVSAGQATQTLQNDHLTVGTSTVRTSNTTKGDVVSTDPKAGASVSKNSAVNLVVSGGPNIPTVVVPAVTGKQLTQAIALLQGANLGVHRPEREQQPARRHRAEPGPAGGTKILATRKVVLTVSGTQTSVSVPSVVGQSPAARRRHPARARPDRGQPDHRLLGPAQRRGVRAEPGRRHQRRRRTARSTSSSRRQLRHGPRRRRPDPERGHVGHHGRRPRWPTRRSTPACPGGAQPGNVDSQSPAANAQVHSGTTVNISVCQPTTTTTAPPRPPRRRPRRPLDGPGRHRPSHVRRHGG